MQRTKAQEARFQKMTAALKGIARKRMAKLLALTPKGAARKLMVGGEWWWTAKQDLFDIARRAGIGLRTAKVQAIVRALESLGR